MKIQGEGIKVENLKPCASCGGLLTGEGGRNPAFQVLRFSLAIVNARGLQRRMGLAQMLGGGSAGFNLAGVMGPSEPAAVIVAEEEGGSWAQVFLCMECWTEKFGLIASAAEAETEASEKE